MSSCSNDEANKQLSDLKTVLEKTKRELNDCSAELAELKNTAENRFIRAKKLLAENNVLEAKQELIGIVQNFKGTDEENLASKEIEKINNKIKQDRLEAERKKTLGFSILKPTMIVEYGNLSMRFDKIWVGKRWIFDDYGNQYFLRDSKRGYKHILTRVSITSETNNPSLPPVLAYQINNGELKLLGSLEYKFRRWEDYGSYLGNYADYGNDFSHSKTIPFNGGLELSEPELKNKNIYIVMKKFGCFNRVKKDYGRPEIEYVEGNCSTKEILKVEDFDNDYVLLKML